MADGNIGTAHLGGLFGACTGGRSAPVSISHSRLSQRQWQRFINETVSKLVNRLLIEQTKSRPRRGGDNGLIETSKGAVIGKHIGPGSIDRSRADRINGFYRDDLNPCLKYHCLCAQADVAFATKVRKRVRYRRYRSSVGVPARAGSSAAAGRPGISVNARNRVAGALGDTDAAAGMQQKTQVGPNQGDKLTEGRVESRGMPPGPYYDC